MSFDPETAAIRFGMGLAPDIAPPASTNDMLRRLGGADDIAARYPIKKFGQVEGMIWDFRQQHQIRRKNSGTAKAEKALENIRTLRREARKLQADWLKSHLARGIYTDDGLRERLVRFWADHFTVVGKALVLPHLTSSYIEEAIRPNITGRFSELLKAATFHPMMLHYLDQLRSVGPNSKIAARKPGRGLNENLAREVLELHTLGVSGAYDQNDVRALTRLFTGLTYRFGKGFTFDVKMAEPGTMVVLGNSYGGPNRTLNHIAEFLDDLAVHPDTARHLAHKLAVHFVSDSPDPAMVDQIAQAYLESDGDLMVTYRAMLAHPSAWAGPDEKIKQPIDFVISGIRALGMDQNRLAEVNEKDLRLWIVAPMGLMGQLWEKPRGPDGWPESADDWITPQGLAARIQWAMSAPTLIRPDLPDPRIFVDNALGSRASEALWFAAAGAEVKSDGIGLILASPEFQRH